MSTFDFKKFLSDNGLTAKELVDTTGYNKNTFTKWSNLESDTKIPQDFILSILKNYPNINLSIYFPTHAAILEICKLKLIKGQKINIHNIN